ncbi:MAG TPA: DUF58 domain-containing protein [Chloroflexota bacterium]
MISRLLGRRRSAGVPPTVSAAETTNVGLLSEDLLRRIERLSLRVRRPLPGGPAGEHLGLGQSASIEFADHRQYSPGDDFRRIDWNALARLDELTIRLTEAREDVGLYLVLDCSSSMASGDGVKSHLARQLAAGLAYLALNQLDVVRVYGLGNGMVARSPRYTGRKQSADVFRWLRSLPGVPATDLGAAFVSFLADRPGPGLVIVLSDLLNTSEYRPGLRRIVQAGFEVAMVHILSEAELNPHLWGDVELIDSETAETIKISMTLDTLATYRRDLERWQHDIADFCRSLGVRYVQIPAERGLESILLGDFRRHGILE